MKLLRLLAFPLVPFYFVVTWLRNKAFDFGWLSSKSYNFPLICVGNLSVGGTGKSPMVSYLISILKDEITLATLSRGYGRETEGFVMAKSGMTHKDLGDESFQYYKNFKNEITVAVCEDRQNGIAKLRNLEPKPKLVILDDAYQHRKVKAGLNILLSTYSNLFTDDFMLPTGDLREPKNGYKRADIIVVTKCPEFISSAEKKRLTKKIKPLKTQHLFFSHIKYGLKIKSFTAELNLLNAPKFTLITGIANAKPLVYYLNKLNLVFNHLSYKDHYNFSAKDIEAFEKLDFIITTEKDYMRLQEEISIREKLYYLPIEVVIDRKDKFDALVKDYALH